MKVTFYTTVNEADQGLGKVPDHGLNAYTERNAYAGLYGIKEYKFVVDIPCLDEKPVEQLEVLEAREIVMTPKTKKAKK